MKEEDQRIAIAEACGWKQPDHPDVMKFKIGWTMPEHWWMCPNGVLRLESAIPDYLNDLNVMHEVVRSLPDEQKPYYMKHLFYVLIKQKGDAGVSDFDKHLASASVCAEAFLKTIGKWTDYK